MNITASAHSVVKAVKDFCRMVVMLTALMVLLILSYDLAKILVGGNPTYTFINGATGAYFSWPMTFAIICRVVLLYTATTISARQCILIGGDALRFVGHTIGMWLILTYSAILAYGAKMVFEGARGDITYSAVVLNLAGMLLVYVLCFIYGMFCARYVHNRLMSSKTA